jgi:CRISPR-associated protein Csx10
MSEITLTLRQPAQIGDRSREDFVLSTLDYIPGTVVRGALAAAWLARNGVSRPGTPQRAEFLRLFEGPVRFGALLRTGTEFPSLSLVGHKYPATDDCAVREYDLALIDDAPIQCPDCDSPFEPGKKLRGGRPDKKRRTSVSIGDGGVALSGQLFTRETLAAGQDFTGTIVAPSPSDLDALVALGPVRVGGRRTTHGLAAVTIRNTAQPPTAQLRADGKLVIRLRSPGIFTNRQGRPIPEPDQAELRHVLGMEAKVERRWARWQQVGGWHVASGLPKPAELAVAAGSTYLIWTERTVPQSTLEALGRRGLGLRRHEGFGDLAPPPVLDDGKAAREEKQRSQRQFSDSVAELRGFPARYPRLWPQVREALRGHVNGNARGTAFLERVAERLPDPSMVSALRKFLAMSPQDAAYVAGELTGQ